MISVPGAAMKLRPRRLACRYLTTVETEEGTVPVRLSDLSSTGAMAEGALRLQRGAVLRVSLLGRPVDARVMRISSTGGVGLRFLSPVAADHVAAVRNAAARAGEAEST